MLLNFSWLVTLLGTCFTTFSLVTTLGEANGAPQQAAGAAIAAALVVIPYVFTRAIEGMIAATPERILTPKPLAEHRDPN